LRDEKAKNASLAAHNRDLADKNDKLDNKNNELENALRAKDKELQNALKRIKELEDLILKKDADLDDLRNKNKALRDDLKKKNNELQAALAELQRLTLTSDSQTSELQIQIKDKDDEIARMYAALDKIEKDFQLSLEAKKREMDEINKLTMAQYHRDLDDLKDQLQKKDKEIQELKNRIAELQKQMAELQQENCTLQAQLGEANKTKDDKDKELGDIKAQLELWRQRHADLVNDLQNAKIKLVADDLEPQFQKYDGLLKLEESRLGVPVGGRGVDQNNNRM
jgi:chromosome segregation ATPase